MNVVVIGTSRIHGVGHTVLLGLAEVVDQQVAGDGRNPRDERALG